MAHVLVVDDNEQNLYMLRILLESNGHQVSAASHGAEALEAARRNRPDLMITDILMPVMDGFTLCRQWKADPVLRSVPLVFYTATYTDAKDEAFAMSLGADRFLVKPQDPDRILALVNQLVSELPGSPGPNPNLDFDEAEVEFLRRHNAVLFEKLEKKVADLDRARADLERDFALRRDLQRQLLQAQKMESLGQVAGGLVHDFNNVLTAIGGFASLIQLNKGDPAASLESAQGILDAVRLGSSLSHQLLAFARQQDLSLGPLDINALVEASLPLVRSTLPAGVTLAFHPAEGLPPVVGDPDQLQRVWFNLMVNARDAMVTPGTLTVDTCSLDLSDEFVRHRGADQPGCYVRVRFQDTGVGIAPGDLGRIFDPLFTTKKTGTGTGLGLSVVHGIVHQHRGFVQVSSLVGRGTSFEVYLPASTGK